MTNPQYTLTVALGVGAEGLKRREVYEKSANGKPLSQWVRETLDKASEKPKRPASHGYFAGSNESGTDLSDVVRMV